MVKTNSISLREKQSQALDKCKENHSYGVFFAMATGKTATMLSLIDYLVFDKLEINSVLIIAPPSVVNKSKVWQKEIKKWKNFEFFDFIELKGTQDERKDKKNNSNCSITLINDTLIDWYYNTYKNLDDYDMIIIDESSRFKNSKAKKFIKLSKMIKDQRIYLLSGTPMPNGFQDLWSQIFLLDKGKRLENNYYHFMNKYSHKINKYKSIFTKQIQKLLTEKVSDICMFNDGSDIKLSKKYEYKIMLEWSDKKKEIYKDFKKQYVLSLKEGDITVKSIASYINKTLQLANGAVYIDNNLSYVIFDDTKLEWVKNFVKTARDNMLIFYSYKFDKIRLLESVEGAREIMTDKDVDDWNNRKIKVGIISPYSFQYGANLQYGGSIIIWYGLMWGLENYLQSNARIYRPGQDKIVEIYYLLMENTNDDSVFKRLISKEIDENEFLESIKI